MQIDERNGCVSKMFNISILILFSQKHVVMKHLLIFVFETT